MTARILKFISQPLLWLLLPAMAMAQANQPSEKKILIDGVAAVVGDFIILKSEVDDRYDEIKRQAPEEMQGMTPCSMFEDLLMEKLFLHHAEIDSVIVGDEEVEGNIDRRIQFLVQQIGSEKRLEEYYKKSIFEIKDEMRGPMKSQLTAQRMQARIVDDIKITPSEVQEFYNKIPKDSLPLINTEVELAQIVIYPEVNRDAVQEAIDRLKELKERIINGSSFSTMAILYSEDPGSAKQGGEYKGIKRGQFVKEFEAVAFNLKEGEVSDPFKTEYGYHIVQVLKRRGQELDLRHILIKPKLSDEDLEMAKTELDSIRKKILKGEMTFEEAANKYSQDEQTRYNGGVLVNFNTGDTKWEINMLERSMFQTSDRLKVGEISDPSFFRKQDGKEGYRLIKVLNRIDPHKADLRHDYTRIKEIALNEKRGKAIAEWVNEKTKDTYVKLNRGYFDCEFEYEWIKNTP